MVMFAYEKLEIWRLAVEFAKDIYEITEIFPKSEVYGLTNQLRRAAISISSNIAEGSGSSTAKDNMHYIDICIKSALETTSELQVALELGYISSEDKDLLYEKAEKIIRKARSFKSFLNR